MFWNKKPSEFDERAEEIRAATERLRRNLHILREIVGVKQGLVDLYEPGAAGFGTITEVLSTALASIEVLANRVNKLEGK
jgi:hypothetical protein